MKSSERVTEKIFKNIIKSKFFRYFAKYGALKLEKSKNLCYNVCNNFYVAMPKRQKTVSDRGRGVESA